jgi:nucleotide-binding universal stress UspA family protein
MNILLAVDGSPSADRARDLVAALPWHEGGRVRIVTVAPTRAELLGVPWMAAVPHDAPTLEDEVLRIHGDALTAAEREIHSARSDVVIEPVLARGRAATVIVDQARDMPADLIVVGHRGLSGWESMLLGTVSNEVVDQAPCPVLVARDERLGPIVLANDGSAWARSAETVVTEWPIFAGLPVTVLSVIEDGFPYAATVAPLLYMGAMAEYSQSFEVERRSTRELTEAAADRLCRAGRDAAAQVREGDAAHEIVACARERDAGLIVVGTRGRTGSRRLILGRVARNVLLHAPCSVLVVREPIRVGRPPTDGPEARELVSAFG